MKTDHSHLGSILVISALIFACLWIPSVSANSTPTTKSDFHNRAVGTSSAVARTTSFYSVAYTPIPSDSYSIGVGQNGTGGNLYWVSCIDAPYTTVSSYGGCGYDDLYTRCSGQTAFGIDGKSILCDLRCVTHKVFDDLDVSSFVPFVGCGRGTSIMNLVRTTTGVSTTLNPPEAQTTEPPVTTGSSGTGLSTVTEIISVTTTKGSASGQTIYLKNCLATCILFLVGLMLF